MYIKHLYIDSFAALKGKELSLSEGLNVIEGLNESGKSTVCTFIKFMLYGLSGRTSDGEMSERQKYVPWDTGRAAGSLTIVADGTEYRIDRELTIFDDSQPRERCEVTDLSTGERHFKGEAPGVAILGMMNSGGTANPRTKASTYRLSSEVTVRFTQMNGATLCGDLKGLTGGPVLRSCDGCIEDATRITLDMLEQNANQAK